MERFDTIVVGGGMGGLSTAAFLTLEGHSTLVLEKHDKVGGLASSFELSGSRFDIGIEGIRELAPDSFLHPFLRWWGVDLPMDARPETMSVFTGRGRYTIRGESARDDLRDAFPLFARRIERFFELNSKIILEMTGSGRPKAPYEMSLSQKLAYGFSSLYKRPNLLKYGLRDASKILPSLLGDPDLVRVAASKTMEDMVYLAIAHRWEGLQSGKIMYPRGGIGAVPEAVAASIALRGGSVRTSTEVTALRQTQRGYLVLDSKGNEYESRSLVVAAPMPWAVFTLFRDDGRFDALRAAISKRRAFPGCFMAFATLDPSFDLGGANYIVDWGNKTGCDKDPETATIALMVAGLPEKSSKPVPITIMATLGWDYASRWGTRAERGLQQDSVWDGIGDKYRGADAYKQIKNRTTEVLLNRLENRLGRGFRKAIITCVSATPLTLTRFTNNPGGSYLGFNIRAGEYGRFFPQKSPLPGLYFAGQWVFPGFGIAGVSASGYFAAKSLLMDRGIDLDVRLASIG